MFATLITEVGLMNQIQHAQIGQELQNSLDHGVTQNISNSFTFDLTKKANLLADIQSTILIRHNFKYQIIYSNDNPVSFIG